jgi:hypothetical protein
LLKGNVIGCLTAVYDTGFFGKVEMPPLARRQDYGLWLELLRRTPYAYSLPQVLADYRVRPGSLSADKISAARATWSLYRREERLPLLRSAWYFAHYAANGIAKRCPPLPGGVAHPAPASIAGGPPATAPLVVEQPALVPPQQVGPDRE